MNKKLKKICTVLSVVLMLGVLSGCAKENSKMDEKSKETIKITHNGGETEVRVNPERVIVLDYGSLDIIDELGAEDSIVGVPKSSLPTYLSNYNNEKYTDIGGIKEFNFEKINELNPDLIIIEGRQADSYEELNRIAPTIYLGSDSKNYINEGEEKISVLESRITELNKKITENNYDALLTMVTDGSMNVYGNGSRFNILFNELGFKCTDETIEVSSHGQNISNEYLVTKDPGFLFVIDKGVITGTKDSKAKEIIENELVRTTNVYKNGNIIYLNAEAWYVGGAGNKSADLMLDDIENAIK